YFHFTDLKSANVSFLEDRKKKLADRKKNKEKRNHFQSKKTEWHKKRPSVKRKAFKKQYEKIIFLCPFSLLVLQEHQDHQVLFFQLELEFQWLLHQHFSLLGSEEHTS